jgi:Zn-dependent M16 (insulinase) family peptidase
MTAVEWFAKELYEKFEMKGDGKVFDDLLEQAKKMDKKQSKKMPEYDLDELALIKYPIVKVSFEEFTIDSNALKRIGFIVGFQEALELLTFKQQEQ